MLVQYGETKRLITVYFNTKHVYVHIYTHGAPFAHLSVTTQWEAAVQRQKASLLFLGKMVRHSQDPHSRGDV